jgi:hypothetical protein
MKWPGHKFSVGLSRAGGKIAAPPRKKPELKSGLRYIWGQHKYFPHCNEN